MPVKQLREKSDYSSQYNRHCPCRSQDHSKSLLQCVPASDAIEHIRHNKHNIGIAAHEDKPCKQTEYTGVKQSVLSLRLPALIPAQVKEEQIKQEVRIDMGKAGVIGCIMKQVGSIGNHHAGKQ